LMLDEVHAERRAHELHIENRKLRYNRVSGEPWLLAAWGKAKASPHTIPGRILMLISYGEVFHKVSIWGMPFTCHAALPTHGPSLSQKQPPSMSVAWYRWFIVLWFRPC
jgi:hypothetical protein